jgi:hypothetical protein
MRVTNGIPPGCPRFLPVHTVNSVQTLKATSGSGTEGAALAAAETILNLPAIASFLYGARFLTEIYTRGCHWIPRMFA